MMWQWDWTKHKVHDPSVTFGDISPFRGDKTLRINKSPLQGGCRLR